jgi:hypothetical protein
MGSWIGRSNGSEDDKPSQNGRYENAEKNELEHFPARHGVGRVGHPRMVAAPGRKKT